MTPDDIKLSEAFALVTNRYTQHGEHLSRLNRAVRNCHILLSNGIKEYKIFLATLFYQAVELGLFTPDFIRGNYGHDLANLIWLLRDHELKGKAAFEWQFGNLSRIDPAVVIILVAEKLGNMLEMRTKKPKDWPEERVKLYPVTLIYAARCLPAEFPELKKTALLHVRDQGFDIDMSREERDAGFAAFLETYN